VVVAWRDDHLPTKVHPTNRMYAFVAMAQMMTPINDRNPDDIITNRASNLFSNTPADIPGCCV
tara:strand:- start:551 stop:739 length:189 start_codon:yes stop_codon:yes gene_type:complete